MTVVYCKTLQIGCGGGGGILLRNPNALSCHAVNTGERYAAPISVQTDCWAEGETNLVVWGTAPPDGGTAAFVVRGMKNAAGTLTLHYLPHPQAGCHMDLSLQDLGLECHGDITCAWTLECFKGAEPQPVCSLSWKPTEPYNWYHPTKPFRKYIEEYAEDE